MPSWLAHHSKRQKEKEAPALMSRGLRHVLVGTVGFEPTTPSVSRKCSPPELSAHVCAERSVGYCTDLTQQSPVPTRGLRDRPGLTLAWLSGLRYPTPCAFAHADVAQLVEHNLAKVGVAGSNPVVRSKSTRRWPGPVGGTHRIRPSCCRAAEGVPPASGDVAKWQGRGLQSLYPRFESGHRLHGYEKSLSATPRTGSSRKSRRARPCETRRRRRRPACRPPEPATGDSGRRGTSPRARARPRPPSR